jgi:hypothetical protein
LLRTTTTTDELEKSTNLKEIFITDEPPSPSARDNGDGGHGEARQSFIGRRAGD